MAGIGPPPKEASKRRRKNHEAPEKKIVAQDGRVRGPALPKGVLPDGENWHPRTVAWYATWRKSPQAKIFIATDWDVLVDTALIHHIMWSKGKWEFASEVRLRVAKFGATADDRMRLRMEIETPDKAAKPQPPAEGNVTDISSRRSRLTA